MRWWWRGVAGVIGCAAALVLPNALWLVRSTCEIHNRSRAPLEAVQVQLDDVTLELGTMTLPLLSELLATKLCHARISRGSGA